MPKNQADALDKTDFTIADAFHDCSYHDSHTVTEQLKAEVDEKSARKCTKA